MSRTPTEIKSLARSHTEAAIKTLVGVMNQKKAPEAARVAAANSLLDRGWGKPKQELDHSSADGTMTPPKVIELVSGGQSEG